MRCWAAILWLLCAGPAGANLPVVPGHEASSPRLESACLGNLTVLVDRADLNSTTNLVRSYTWGQDLSGILDGAGGIGGLLMVTEHGASVTNHFVAYDGNGNVTALVRTDGTVSARYEYGPFGEPIRATGPLAKLNPFRWSTKYCDEETGLVYYGYRYCSPSLGRWVSRDPLGELNFRNLTVFCRNQPIGRWDPDGRFSLCDTLGSVGVSAGIGGFVGYMLAPKGERLHGMLAGAGAGGQGAFVGVGGGVLLAELGFSDALVAAGASITSAAAAAYIGIAANNGRFSLTQREAMLVGGTATMGLVLGGLVARSAAALSVEIDEFVLDFTITIAASMGVGVADVWTAVAERATAEGLRLLERRGSAPDEAEERP